MKQGTPEIPMEAQAQIARTSRLVELLGGKAGNAALREVQLEADLEQALLVASNLDEQVTTLKAELLKANERVAFLDAVRTEQATEIATLNDRVALLDAAILSTHRFLETTSHPLIVLEGAPASPAPEVLEQTQALPPQP